MSIRSAAASRSVASQTTAWSGADLRWINCASGIEPTLDQRCEMKPAHESDRTPDRLGTRRWAALCRPEESLSAERLRNISPHQMGPDGVLPRRLLPVA